MEANGEAPALPAEAASDYKQEWCLIIARTVGKYRRRRYRSIGFGCYVRTVRYEVSVMNIVVLKAYSVGTRVVLVHSTAAEDGGSVRSFLARQVRAANEVYRSIGLAIAVDPQIGFLKDMHFEPRRRSEDVLQPSRGRMVLKESIGIDLLALHTNSYQKKKGVISLYLVPAFARDDDHGLAISKNDNIALTTLLKAPGTTPLENSFLMISMETPLDRTLAHELGHILLGNGNHEDDNGNLMARVPGIQISAEQGKQMLKSEYVH
jgi:hypothetical protein